MNFFIAILIGLIPAACWGLYPVLCKKYGGNSKDWMACSGFGITFLTLFIVPLVAIVFPEQWAELDHWVYLIMFTSGICWSILMFAQFSLCEGIGVSTAIPLANATKTIMVTSIYSAIILPEISRMIKGENYEGGGWIDDIRKMILGTLLVIIICVGIWFLSKKDNSKNNGKDLQSLIFK